MSQLTFAEAEYANKKRKTRREGPGGVRSFGGRRANQSEHESEGGAPVPLYQTSVWLQQGAVSRVAEEHEPFAPAGGVHQSASYEEVSAGAGEVRLLIGQAPSAG